MSISIEKYIVLFGKLSPSALSSGVNIVLQGENITLLPKHCNTNNYPYRTLVSFRVSSNVWSELISMIGNPVKFGLRALSYVIVMKAQLSTLCPAHMNSVTNKMIENWRVGRSRAFEVRPRGTETFTKSDTSVSTHSIQWETNMSSYVQHMCQIFILPLNTLHTNFILLVNRQHIHQRSIVPIPNSRNYVENFLWFAQIQTWLSILWLCVINALSFLLIITQNHPHFLLPRSPLRNDLFWPLTSQIVIKFMT